MAEDLSFLDNETVDKLPIDYVIVCNSFEYLGLSDSYKGRKVIRFRIVEKGMVYVMPDPMITDEQILALYGKEER